MPQPAQCTSTPCASDYSPWRPVCPGGPESWPWCTPWLGDSVVGGPGYLSCSVLVLLWAASYRSLPVWVGTSVPPFLPDSLLRPSLSLATHSSSLYSSAVLETVALSASCSSPTDSSLSLLTLSSPAGWSLAPGKAKSPSKSYGIHSSWLTPRCSFKQEL